MSHHIIAYTKSLSPISFKEVEADIIKENGNVYLIKHNEQNQISKSLIEKDYEFYNLLTKDKIATQLPATHVIIYVSSTCNLNCSVCYEDELKEPSLADIRNILENFKNTEVYIGGKEPTCRKDLFRIIKMAHWRNRVVLVTNGLKLSDYGYVARLKKSGLRNICLSFNGLDDEVYRIINGQSLLKSKLKALKNIKRSGLQAVLSTTIVRDVNEDQIAKLCNLCFDNRSFIAEFRIRTMISVGKSLDKELYCMSELLGLVLVALDIKRDVVMKEYFFMEEIFKSLKCILSGKIRKNLISRLCSFTFHVIKREKIYPLSEKINLERMRKSRFKVILLVYYLFRLYGIRYILERLWMDFLPFRVPGILRNKSILKISLKCWPHLHNVDMAEIKKCTNLLYKGGKGYPFCYYNIIGTGKCG